MIICYRHEIFEQAVMHLTDESFCLLIAGTFVGSYQWKLSVIKGNAIVTPRRMTLTWVQYVVKFYHVTRPAWLTPDSFTFCECYMHKCTISVTVVSVIDSQQTAKACGNCWENVTHMLWTRQSVIFKMLDTRLEHASQWLMGSHVHFWTCCWFSHPIFTLSCHTSMCDCTLKWLICHLEW